MISRLFSTDVCGGQPAIGPISRSLAYLYSIPASDTCYGRKINLSVSIIIIYLLHSHILRKLAVLVAVDAVIFIGRPVGIRAFVVFIERHSAALTEFLFHVVIFVFGGLTLWYPWRHIGELLTTDYAVGCQLTKYLRKHFGKLLLCRWFSSNFAAQS